MSPESIFPTTKWDSISPSDAGFDNDKFQHIKTWLDDNTKDRRYRVVVVRYGYKIAEWNHQVERDEHIKLASAAKSIYSSVLGIAVRDGKINSADDPVIQYYPEAMDVPAGTGPKEGRHVFPDNHGITLRHLITNTSGYMKPDEAPGKVFHYQTYGMNILTHSIAKAYGYYSIDDPENSPGIEPLVEQWIGKPIGANWRYHKRNFDLHDDARTHIFGYYDGVNSTALDMARLGWLWCNWGRWQDQQLIPEDWLRQATQVASDILDNSPEEVWHYGHGFWTNQHGKLWSNLPRESFAASGAGSQHIWVDPDLSLVVVQSPGLWDDQEENNEGLLKLIIDALA